MNIKQKIKMHVSLHKAFNRFLENGSLERPILTELTLLRKELEEKGVFLCYFEPPRADSVKKLSFFEKARIKKWMFNFNHIADDMDKLARIYGEGADPAYLEHVHDGVQIVNLYGRKAVMDFESEEVNIINGTRCTTCQPRTYCNTIYIHGSCTARGAGVCDDDTIESFLQRKINEWAKDTYRVVNKGIGFGSTVLDDIAQIREIEHLPGDIVVILNYVSVDFLSRYRAENKFETSSLFDRPHDFGEWFTDDTPHTTPAGNRVIAGYMFQVLSQRGLLRRSDAGRTPQTRDMSREKPRKKEDFIAFTQQNDFHDYMALLQENRRDGKRSGGIVMNCNPFTLGHRYLIESSAAKVDVLYIFVVEENKSVFPFDDRFMLVQKGTADLDNVVVLPSGKFIISTQTFPGYFLKDDAKDAIFDSSQDVDIFALFIAPALDISVRFVGEEPIDMVTRQYNETMRRRLPLYGIEFDEIPRKELGENVISASRVRAFLKDQNFGEIEKMVPATTLAYLKDRFGTGVKNDNTG